MDTQTFVVKRERLQAHLETARALGLLDAGRKKSWLFSLPLLPLAGLLAAKGLQRESHPIVRGFFIGTARKLLQTAARRWGLDSWMQPGLLKKIFN